jgi:hypothetical protein
MHFHSRATTPLDPRLARINWRSGHADPLPLAPINQWLTVKQFGYERRRDYPAVLQLLAKFDDELKSPPDSMLFVQTGALTRAYTSLASISYPSAGARILSSRKGLLCRVEFAVSLDIIEYPQAVFSLFAEGRVPVALPAPCLLPVDTIGAAGSIRAGGARLRRHLVAIAAGFAVAAAPGWATGVADAASVSHGALHRRATSNMVVSGLPTAAQPTTVIKKTTTAPINAIAPHATRTRKKHTMGSAATHSAPAATAAPRPGHHDGTRGHGHHNHHESSHATAPGTQDNGAHHTPYKPKVHTPRLGPSHHAESHGHQNHHEPSGATGPATHDGGAQHKPSNAKVHTSVPGLSHHFGPHSHHHLTGAAVVALAPSTPSAPAPAAASQPAALVIPAATASPNDPTTIATWLGQSQGSSSWPAGLSPDAFANAAAGQTSSLLGTGAQPPAFLIPIYKAGAKRYQVPWQILAAINWIETDYGSNLNTSSAGAIGWMQFMPATWQQYGVAADGHSHPNPYSPQDAIFSAARYLAANGAAQNLPKAIFGYNHAAWYVAEVIWRAQIITDHAGASTTTSLAGTGQTGLAGAETMLVAAFSAVGGPYSQANHDSLGQTAADLRGAGTDCSGFVSWVLDQVDPGFGNQTTVTLPAQPGIQPGVGQYVTMWDRPLPGDQGHVIINILGTWFESGGNTTYNPAGGISPMSEAQAVGELTGGGFLPYNLKGL